MTPENVIAAFDQYNAMVTSLAKSENIPLADISAIVVKASQILIVILIV